MPSPTDKPQFLDGSLCALDIEAALLELSSLLEKMHDATTQVPLELAQIHPSYRDSAENLLSYLCLRRHDVRPLQRRLAQLGLSSLGRSEGYSLAAVTTVIEVLQRLLHLPQTPLPPCTLDLGRSERLRNDHARALFGMPPEARQVRIMVTMPSEAASDYSIVQQLLRDGMDCIRINCAHDGQEAWLQMIEHLRQAEKELGRSCRIMMDLAGPKLRTGPIGFGAAVMRIRPARNALGRVVRPARVWLSDGQATPPGADACLDVPEQWLAGFKVGDVIDFRDARESKRQLHVVEVTETGVHAELYKTAYIIPGLLLKCDSGKKGRPGKAKIGSFPPCEQVIELSEGDTLILTADTLPGWPAARDDSGQIISPAMIGCTLPEVFAEVHVGEPIWFDDGKIGGVIEAIEEGALHVRITHAMGVAKLHSDKGINLPDSQLTLTALALQDLDALEFAARHADVVELSFANSVEDVQSLLQRIEHLQAPQLGVVLKIETRRGFENLPAMLLAGMRTPRFGVMIARGDLAVESGFERLAELQEEILCLCEAAHVPVIWATQVLDTLARTGAPSRAEITDAAMGVRAECVMLNKGPHILEAVHMLDGLLTRMQGHRDKKRDLLRKLRVAQHGAAPQPC